MSESDDLARLLERTFGSFLAHDPHKPDVFWPQMADAILAAGWIPRSRLALVRDSIRDVSTERLRERDALAATVARVRAACDRIENSTAIPIGWEAATRSTVSIASIRAALDPEEPPC